MAKFESKEELLFFLKNKAADIRKKVIELTGIAGGGHTGGALSMVDIIVLLYHHILKIDSQNPEWEERDRFILSKGHGALALCPVLSSVGFFPEEKMNTFNQLDSPFGMHPDMHKIPGVEMSTGSLGHGLPVAIGVALSGRLDKANWRVYCLLGDGECNEGSVWEAAMSAAHYQLGNLTVIVDRNHFCLDGPTEEIMALGSFKDKWRAFGWNVVEMNGHNFEEMLDTFKGLPPISSSLPTVIIAETVKGKGVSFMEARAKWHYGGLDDEMERQALEDIEKTRPKG